LEHLFSAFAKLKNERRPAQLGGAGFYSRSRNPGAAQAAAVSSVTASGGPAKAKRRGQVPKRPCLISRPLVLAGFRLYD